MADIARFTNPQLPPSTPSAESITTLSVPTMPDEEVPPPVQEGGDGGAFAVRFLQDLSGTGSPDAGNVDAGLFGALVDALLQDAGLTASQPSSGLINNRANANPPDVKNNDGGETSWGIDAQTDRSSLAGDTTALGNEEVAQASSEPALETGSGAQYVPLSDNQYVQQDGAELFPGGGPTPYDVFQGTNGDCYLMATMASMAQHDPSALANMIKPTGNGTFAVTLYYQGKPETVNVDASVPTGPDGRPDFAQISTDPNNGKVILWPLIMEKAFAKFADQHPDVLDTTAKGYNALNLGGFGSEAFAALTGQAVYTNTPQNMNENTLAEALSCGAGGNMVTLGTVSNASGGDYTSHGLLASHMYTVLGTATSDTGQLLVKVRDPWGSEPNDPNAVNGTFYVPFSDVLSDCQTINVGQQPAPSNATGSGGGGLGDSKVGSGNPFLRYSR